MVDQLNQEAGWVTDETSPAIALDTDISPELKDKGVIRELVRYINSLRKEAGLKPSDKPRETYFSDSPYLNSLLDRFKEEIMSSTAAGDLVSDQDGLSISKEVVIDGEKIILGIKS